MYSKTPDVLLRMLTRYTTFTVLHYCQVLLYDKYFIYWVYSSITHLVPHCHSCLRHLHLCWQQTHVLSQYFVYYSLNTQSRSEDIQAPCPPLLHLSPPMILPDRATQGSPALVAVATADPATSNVYAGVTGGEWRLEGEKGVAAATRQSSGRQLRGSRLWSRTGAEWGKKAVYSNLHIHNCIYVQWF